MTVIYVELHEVYYRNKRFPSTFLLYLCKQSWNFMPSHIYRNTFKTSRFISHNYRPWYGHLLTVIYRIFFSKGIVCIISHKPIIHNPVSPGATLYSSWCFKTAVFQYSSTPSTGVQLGSSKKAVGLTISTTIHNAPKTQERREWTTYSIIIQMISKEVWSTLSITVMSGAGKHSSCAHMITILAWSWHQRRYKNVEDNWWPKGINDTRTQTS